ncbi:electron transfer flavoprotein subunit beta/FixA family protein [Muricomes intestini]|jgi:electron transfer flavoprotein beta subunit|uniref:electron transfer flavoprotein subunit beta/FixA family protein n=1 Tax=Muricomes intestini TaxID=1796634 RepID=UPI000E7FEF15|nr:electron transfer flavoprotein subunit beta [Lachnospiraceae bacterium]HCR84562.1 electron transfer flavoprotein subunit beta [Lachnospiraceae bacterium]
MKILVFIKQVPDTINVRIDPKTGNLDRTGLKGVINPFDNNALEAALKIKEETGAAITVVSMGPPQTEESLRIALAMGCDEAVILCAKELGGADTLATGYTLASAVKKIGDYDLLLFGRHAVDADTGQCGPIVAEFLNLPQITFATSIKVEENHVICERDFDDYIQKVKVKLPAVVTVCAEINEPRYPSPLGIMKAMKKPLITWTHEDMGCDTERIGKNGSPSIVREIFEPEHTQKDTIMFSGETDEIAKSIVDLLEQQHLI